MCSQNGHSLVTNNVKCVPNKENYRISGKETNAQLKTMSCYFLQTKTIPWFSCFRGFIFNPLEKIDFSGSNISILSKSISKFYGPSH